MFKVLQFSGVKSCGVYALLLIFLYLLALHYSEKVAELLFNDTLIHHSQTQLVIDEDRQVKVAAFSTEKIEQNKYLRGEMDLSIEQMESLREKEQANSLKQGMQVHRLQNTMTGIFVLMLGLIIAMVFAGGEFGALFTLKLAFMSNFLIANLLLGNFYSVTVLLIFGIGLLFFRKHFSLFLK